MPAPEEFFKDLREQLLGVDTIEEKDALLDEWYDAQSRATDYDAIQWGFDPKRWMSETRKKIEAKIAEERAVSRRSSDSTREEKAQG